MRLALVAMLAAGPALAACNRQVADLPAAHPHFVLGAPYRAGGVWRYPQERYEGAETGLAVVQPKDHPALTADGEPYDPDAAAAAHPTLQLPAIVEVTNLENGRRMLVRVNDRGPESPGRLLALTPRAAGLLGVPADGGARIRLTVMPGASHAAAEGLPGAPRLAIAAAPRDAVIARPLGTDAAPPILPAAAREAVASPPSALADPAMSETVTQGTPEPGALFVRLNSFTDRRYAASQTARFGARAQTRMVPGGGFVTLLGPFATIRDADAALDQAIRAGVTDARIVVE